MQKIAARDAPVSVFLRSCESLKLFAWLLVAGLGVAPWCLYFAINYLVNQQKISAQTKFIYR